MRLYSERIVPRGMNLISVPACQIHKNRNARYLCSFLSVSVRFDLAFFHFAEYKFLTRQMSILFLFSNAFNKLLIIQGHF